jgi:hypothetical protein
VLLHQGRVLDTGKACDIAGRAGAAGIRMAFEKLTAASGEVQQ